MILQTNGSNWTRRYIFNFCLIVVLMINCLFVGLNMLNQQVNSYPMGRGFTAIGTGGEDFVQAMVFAVESVIQEPIPEV